MRGRQQARHRAVLRPHQPGAGISRYIYNIYSVSTLSTQCSATQHTQQAAVRDCYGYIELCYAAAGDSAADQVGCWPVIGC